jgi:hypothetical protein
MAEKPPARTRRAPPRATSSADRPWRELAEDVAAGDVTLVVGAGVTLPRGVPSWLELVRRVCARVRVDPPAVPRAGDDGEAVANPTFLQIALEEVEHALRADLRGERNPVLAARRAFADVLAEELYAELGPPCAGSLSTLAAVLRADQRRERRRITRVVTLNADDLLESETNRGHDPIDDPVVWPVARAHHHPRRSAGAHGRPPIPVYHVHGFLPRDRRRAGADFLVFTDAQYQASMANPLGLANRVFANALHDSHCLFVGLSMTDLNVGRWLGLHAHDVEQARLSDFEWGGDGGRELLLSLHRSLRRHYWVRTDARDVQALERHLLRRGVVSAPVRDWERDFDDRMRVAFRVR